MARLRDLVQRSALRNRSAGDSELGLPTGMDYHVFEVTDLSIPAGTDWSAVPLNLGTIDAQATVAYVAAVYLQLAAIPPVGIQLFGTCGVGALQVIADAGATGVGADAKLWHPGTGVVSADIWSDSEITADIVILHARAAFLIV